ncbi:hypothetical protein LJR039_006889 [Pseudorhodoferax sp. LjRoot39]|uniref:hypothetical protein n=1 Tax=Pseudorhodoferax sp. LjRoot39 TaxID=3342328 RepID=UPI003ECD2225
MQESRAGPPDRTPFIHIPAGFIKVGHGPRYTWPFKTMASAEKAAELIPQET